jgi:hypothetical protein
VINDNEVCVIIIQDGSGHREREAGILLAWGSFGIENVESSITPFLLSNNYPSSRSSKPYWFEKMCQTYYTLRGSIIPEYRLER